MGNKDFHSLEDEQIDLEVNLEEEVVISERKQKSVPPVNDGKKPNRGRGFKSTRPTRQAGEQQQARQEPIGKSPISKSDSIKASKTKTVADAQAFVTPAPGSSYQLFVGGALVYDTDCSGATKVTFEGDLVRVGSVTYKRAQVSVVKR